MSADRGRYRDVVLKLRELGFEVGDGERRMLLLLAGELHMNGRPVPRHDIFAMLAGEPIKPKGAA